MSKFVKKVGVTAPPDIDFFEFKEERLFEEITGEGVIYALFDPLKEVIFYVGQTRAYCLHARLCSHYTEAYSSSEARNHTKNQYLRELNREGVSAKILYIEEVPEGEDLREREAYWIRTLDFFYKLENSIIPHQFFDYVEFDVEKAMGLMCRLGFQSKTYQRYVNFLLDEYKKMSRFEYQKFLTILTLD